MKTIRYEDAAEQVKVTYADGREVVAWSPVGQPHVIWFEEHMARYSAATDFPCKCGGRHEKGWTCCRECRGELGIDRFDEAYAKNAQPWDGKSPVVVFDSDQFFFDEDLLGDYLYERVCNGDKIEDVRLLHCKPDNGHYFEMSEFLSDSLAEDSEINDDEINATVNKWIKDHAPFSYWPDDKTPVHRDSIRGIWDECVKQHEQEKAGAQ